MKPGIPRGDSESSPDPSLDRKSATMPGSAAASFYTASSTSTKLIPNSKRLSRILKEYSSKLVDVDIFVHYLKDWVNENIGEHFGSPFPIEDLQSFDFALEGVLFQQLIRMPCPPFTSENLKEVEFSALEDFLYTAAEEMWHTFWHKNKSFPYFVSCPRHPRSKFYTVEKAISRRRLGGLCGAALVSKKDNLYARWDDIVKFVMFEHSIISLYPSVVCKALFYAIHILFSRSLSKYNAVTSESDCVFVSVVDSRFGGVVKFGGDLGRLEVDSCDPYKSVAEWIISHAEIHISPVERVWNKLGNVNWGDLGSLQILMAIFYSMAQCNGPPRKSVASLEANRSLRLQKRRIETSLVEKPLNYGGEIVEVESQNFNRNRKGSHLNFSRGEILSLEDQQGRKSFQIQRFVDDGTDCSYIAVSTEYSMQLLSLYIGAHPSRLEPSWENMNLWYQVQRQTKVLNVLKEHGISSKHLPEIVASGRIVHSGPCEKRSPKGCCDHPWCGTPILGTCPVGEPISSIIAQDGPFSAAEATRCCRDCLAALRSARIGNILHGDIRPESVVRMIDERANSMFVLLSWGRAVLEDRDSPALNLQFSSAHALEHGKLCPSSDVESLVYLIYVICGGSVQQQDSIESALEWRRRCWAKRVIQQQLGKASPILKAFADYVDSICGTPYAVDYDVWVKRLNKAVDGSTETGKLIDEQRVSVMDVAESSEILCHDPVWP